MNLTHLFNMNYFIQNIKKSKAVIIFISLLLPVFTLLTLSIINENANEVIGFSTLGIPNIFFMYIIPVILSIQLFNYVFKKKSCDYIGSMPLSRKTIFVTNTLGGIALIVLIQLVTVILTAIYAQIFASGIIFGSMIWDLFVFFTIAYIFVFIVTNLAVSFSGNVFATIVSTMVILFLVPYLLTCSIAHDFDGILTNSYKIEEASSTITFYKPFNFTAPSMIFATTVNDSVYEYNITSMLKMVGLSIAYFAIGYVLFKRKKYEMAEESYENTEIHLIMKFLSITPFISVLSLTKLYESGIALMFFLAVFAVYFFLFDMITNKKLKLGIGISTFVISLLTMLAFFELVVPHLNIFYKKTVKMADIESIRIDTINDTIGLYSNDFGLEVTEGTLIRNMLWDSRYINYTSSISYDYVEANASLTIKDLNGNKYKIKKWLDDSLAKVVEKYGNQKFEITNVKGIPCIDSCRLTNDDRKILLESIEEDLKNLTFKDYFKKVTSDREDYYLTVANYKNHKLLVSDYSYGGFEKATIEAIKICNREAVKNCNIPSWYNMSNQEEFGKYLLKNNMNIYFEDYEEYKNLLEQDLYKEYFEQWNIDKEIDDNFDEIVEFIDQGDGYDYDKTIYGIISSGMNAMSTKKIAEFITSHKDDTFDKTKPYIVFNGYPTVIYYTNSIEDFYKLFAKAYNASEYSKESGFVLNENV